MNAHGGKEERGLGMLEKCPRCKELTLNRRNCGESSIYGARHVICVPCFFEEEVEQEEKGTNNLPEILAGYGPSNE